MGRPKAPKVKYIPAPPPPVTVSTPTQSLRTQVELAKVSGEQNRLNMETGANLDRINEEFYTGQDIRRYRARGAEERLLAQTKGSEDRATLGVKGREDRQTQAQLLAGQERQIGLRGQEERLTVAETGSQTRQTQAQLLAGQERQIGLRGTEERATTRVRGEEQRAGIRESGSETRRTALQQEQFRRYKENSDFQLSRDAYKS